MLLVRPDGIAAFYVAREALTSVDVAYGYELIEDDWKLKFPPLDSRLQEVQLAALNDARRQLQTLRRAAPRQFYGPGGDGKGVFAAAVGMQGRNEAGRNSMQGELAPNAITTSQSGEATDGGYPPGGVGRAESGQVATSDAQEGTSGDPRQPISLASTQTNGGRRERRISRLIRPSGQWSDGRRRIGGRG